MIDCHVNMFGSKPKLNFVLSLEKGYHLELDTLEFLDQYGMQKCQSLIGSIKWEVSLGRIYANAEVITLASFRAEPRQGYVDRAKRVISYLVRFKHVTIRIRTEEPDLSSIPITPYDWEESVYGRVTELLPRDAPLPKGNHAATVSYHDANLYHNVMTGSLVTGFLHFLEKTPIDWCSKNQAIVDTDA